MSSSHIKPPFLSGGKNKAKADREQNSYFGQNFEQFSAIKNSDVYFWKIAVPVMVATILVLTQPIIKRYAKKQWQKAWIFRQKKARAEKMRLRSGPGGLGQVGRTGTMGSVLHRSDTK